MKHTINSFSVMIVLFTIISCEYDNYDPPSAGIQGTVTDAITGESFQSEQPEGYRIRLIEQGYSDPVPIDFWGRADGTFGHSKLFPAEYEVIPIEGAFFSSDAIMVDVQHSETEVNFTVTPFLAITASADLTPDNDVVISYTISRDQAGDKIIQRHSLAAEQPAVSNNVFDHRVSQNLSGITDEDILNTQYSDTLTGLQPGQTYYVRAAARTDNFLGRYNYSEVFEIEIP